MRLPTQWLGVAPFFVFAVMFLILPTLYLMLGAFQNEPASSRSKISSRLSQPSIVGRLLDLDQGQPRLVADRRAGRLGHRHRDRPRRPAQLDTLGNADLFRRRLEFRRRAAGLRVPRDALGRLGLATVLLRDVFGINIYSGFNILSFWGLTLTYLYFQIPLMVVIITPAIDGIKKEWGEAAATLGATTGNTGAWWSFR